MHADTSSLFMSPCMALLSGAMISMERSGPGRKEGKSAAQRQSSSALGPESTEASSADRGRTNRGPWDAEQVETNIGQGHQGEA